MAGPGRAVAYARVNAHGPASKAELAFMVESATSSELAQVWNDLMARWVPQPPVPDPVQLDLFLARLAADGLWLFEATRPAPLAPEVRQRDGQCGPAGWAWRGSSGMARQLSTPMAMTVSRLRVIACAGPPASAPK